MNYCFCVAWRDVVDHHVVAFMAVIVIHLSYGRKLLTFADITGGAISPYKILAAVKTEGPEEGIIHHIGREEG
jgi:hypothetical protein